ncbi:hypothetical protein 3 [Hubei picorna-like virus 70]|uniref:hypothetical protein 3 n=1 Tax=Hubei picorna-like virus 70 TaxID=1923154 RepID=UPI00090C9EEA|nr:hypothetical protein 3 [Hubei picorna-like virus 70]APG77507.1 hypothetical protein 3 [Hubei picorna-like virus 70]
MNILGGLLDVGAGVGTSFLQNYFNQQNMQQYFAGQTKLQNNQFNNINSQFSKYGLPSFMAYTGGGLNLPRETYQLNGFNTYTGGYAGSNQPTISNRWQENLGWGVPNFKGLITSSSDDENGVSPFPSWTNKGTNPDNNPNGTVYYPGRTVNFQGWDDPRAGLNFANNNSGPFIKSWSGNDQVGYTPNYNFNNINRDFDNKYFAPNGAFGNN